MASVAALNARIAELSSAISRQKDILRDLEQQKSDVQSDLNNILDPMAKLPLEISSDIFMRCLPDHPIPAPDTTVAPLLLMRLWLGRARNSPLSISLSGPLGLDVYESVHHHAHQVQTLELHSISGDDLEDITTVLPSLKTLFVGRDIDDDDPYTYDAHHWVELFRAAPGLAHCTFYNIQCDVPISPISGSQLIHTGLKHLCLGFPQSSAVILLSFTLPALESLIIANLDIGNEDLLAFLTRSSPPLNSFQLVLPSMGLPWPYRMAESLLKLLSRLTDLHLIFSNIPLQVSSFLEVLAIGSPQFVPNLRRLTLTAFPPDCAQLQTLVRTLSVRRSRIQSCRYIFRMVEPRSLIDADILASLRQLVADGMEIHIGLEERNCV